MARFYTGRDRNFYLFCPGFTGYDWEPPATNGQQAWVTVEYRCGPWVNREGEQIDLDDPRADRIILHDNEMILREFTQATICSLHNEHPKLYLQSLARYQRYRRKWDEHWMYTTFQPDPNNPWVNYTKIVRRRPTPPSIRQAFT
jgi:hypothetical protein